MKTCPICGKETVTDKGVTVAPSIFLPYCCSRCYEAAKETGK